MGLRCIGKCWRLGEIYTVVFLPLFVLKYTIYSILLYTPYFLIIYLYTYALYTINIYLSVYRYYTQSVPKQLRVPLFDRILENHPIPSDKHSLLPTSSGTHYLHWPKPNLTHSYSLPLPYLFSTSSGQGNGTPHPAGQGGDEEEDEEHSGRFGQLFRYMEMKNEGISMGDM